MIFFSLFSSYLQFIRRRFLHSFSFHSYWKLEQRHTKSIESYKLSVWSGGKEQSSKRRHEESKRKKKKRTLQQLININNGDHRDSSSQPNELLLYKLCTTHLLCVLLCIYWLYSYIILYRIYLM